MKAYLHIYINKYIHIHIHIDMHVHIHISASVRGPTYIHSGYGVATVSRIDKIIGLFCRIASLLQGSFAKETYNLTDPINQSHLIGEQRR